MKKYGHNIDNLYDTCVDISQHYEPITSRSCLLEIQQEMLSSLSDFATNSRYHNLDSLSSGVSGVDPIEHWGKIFMGVWHSDVTRKAQEKIIDQAGMVTEIVQNNTLTIMSGMEKEPLTTFDALALPGVHDQAARYVVLHLINFLFPLRSLVGDVSRNGYSFDEFVFPQMQELLEWLWNDRKYVLGKKRWP